MPPALLAYAILNDFMANAPDELEIVSDEPLDVWIIAARVTVGLLIFVWRIAEVA
jgi:hypothetical protein